MRNKTVYIMHNRGISCFDGERRTILSSFKSSLFCLERNTFALQTFCQKRRGKCMGDEG